MSFSSSPPDSASLSDLPLVGPLPGPAEGSLKGADPYGPDMFESLNRHVSRVTLYYSAARWCSCPDDVIVCRLLSVVLHIVDKDLLAC